MPEEAIKHVDRISRLLPFVQQAKDMQAEEEAEIARRQMQGSKTTRIVTAPMVAALAMLNGEGRKASGKGKEARPTLGRSKSRPRILPTPKSALILARNGLYVRGTPAIAREIMQRRAEASRKMFIEEEKKKMSAKGQEKRKRMQMNANSLWYTDPSELAPAIPLECIPENKRWADVQELDDADAAEKLTRKKYTVLWGCNAAEGWAARR